MAKRFGAYHVIDMNEFPTPDARMEAVFDLTAGAGADFCMEVAGVVEAFPEATRLVRLGGTVISIGTLNPGQTVAYDPGYALRRGGNDYSGDCATTGTTWKNPCDF